ncbi:hypothetical protein [Mycobacterium sp. shizuoka-1]|uniref:hypothetical protein n=1 Tax=Mycobacterium sp. shizuoka-1 TaxID=2039281 RepID=UPI000C05DDC5|nr:hypothetical protein [Mycobacterium sp. shizuoka-1]GAY14157.1 hypothetical protein MSZK_08830 [Mycobacterium sp. shizuoka-1]
MAVKWRNPPEDHDYDAVDPLQIADGYHRVYASFPTDENASILCRLVSWASAT